jgi:hypothetical protein
MVDVRAYRTFKSKWTPYTNDTCVSKF